MIKQEHTAKKKWCKPELQVLSRGESEENVLAGCKMYEHSIWGDGPGGYQCNIWTGWACNVKTNS